MNDILLTAQADLMLHFQIICSNLISVLTKSYVHGNQKNRNYFALAGFQANKINVGFFCFCFVVWFFLNS